ncbi:hypothetical protein, partial [Segatella buccae]|uniref:hypothetical protein n=1 Tax=Segatella buccae TaxID=28126 RepID=UPI003FD8512C
CIVFSVNLWQDSANESNESLLSNCRAQPILCKDSANESNESSLSNCRAQPILCKDKANRQNDKIFGHISNSCNG